MQTEPENGPVKECQDFHECVVYVSEFANWQGKVSELANWQCEVSEVQMSIKSSQGFLRSTEASSLVKLHFLVF